MRNRITYLKTLLVAVGLTMGVSNVWADETYNFRNPCYGVSSTTSVSLNANKVATIEGLDLYVMNDLTSDYYTGMPDNRKLVLNERFACTEDFRLNKTTNASTKWDDNFIRNKNSSETRYFAVLDLQVGDKVTLTVRGTVKFYTENVKASDADLNVTKGDDVTSGAIYEVTDAGYVAISVSKDGDWSGIKQVDITPNPSTPTKPTIIFSGLTEDAGSYYPTVSITGDDGVTFSGTVNGSAVDVSEGSYAFTAEGTLKVRATKDGISSRATTYKAEEYILANRVETSSLALSNFSSNSGNTGYYWLNPSNASNNTTAVPGLTFNNDNWAVKYSGQAVTYIEQRNTSSRSVTCTVLNEDRVASLVKQGSTDDNWLTATSNSLSFAQWAGLKTYKLFTKSAATVTTPEIGDCGFATIGQRQVVLRGRSDGLARAGNGETRGILGIEREGDVAALRAESSGVHGHCQHS